MKKMVFFPATLMLTAVLSFAYRINNSVTLKNETLLLSKVFASDAPPVFNKRQLSLADEKRVFPTRLRIAGPENYIPGVGKRYWQLFNLSQAHRSNARAEIRKGIISEPEPDCTDNYEPNNTKETAYRTNYVFNYTHLTGLIDTKADVDWFLFDSSFASIQLTFLLTTLPADYDLYLFDRDGNDLGSSRNTGTTSERIVFKIQDKKNLAIWVCVVPNVFAGLSGKKVNDPSNCYTLDIF